MRFGSPSAPTPSAAPAPTEKRSSAPGGIDTLIGASSTFSGDLNFEGSVRIDGKFEGTITSTQDGTLVISEGAQVVGEVKVPNLVLHGSIRGNVYASKSLHVGAKGVLNGDVEYALISLAEGAAVNGRCVRISEKSAAKVAPTPATAV